MTVPHVVVIGGGISGLVAAYRLSQEHGMSVTLLEAGAELGGKIATVPLGDAMVELGADAFLPRDDRPLQLCRDVGLADDLVSPTGFGGMVWRKGGLKPLPQGTVLGFPTSVGAITKAKILTPGGKVRAAMEAFHPRPLTGPDVSVAEFTRRRFGSELLERVIDPLLAGTRAGDVAQMSLAAAIPPVNEIARSHRSVIRGFAKARRSAGGPPRFYAPRSGMRSLVERVAAAVRGDIRLGSSALSLIPSPTGVAVETDAETLDCAGVVIATPSHRAAALVAPWAPQAAWHLDQIPHTSSAVVNFVFPTGAAQTPGRGSGVLVPSSEGMTISGCTWFSSKWPALASPERAVTIRCFVGRGRRDPALDLDDRDLSGVVLTELAHVAAIGANPIHTLVTRWDEGMPVYRVGHLERVARIEELLSAQPRVVLAGADYRGAGIPDCIAQADRAVRSLLGHLRR